MKQLKINYNVFDQHDKLVYTNEFKTSYYDQLPPTILLAAMKMIKHGTGKGYYTITDISTEVIQDDL